MDSFTEARTGRENQLYDENSVRQVAGCVPIDTHTGRVLLIASSKHKGVWVIPKGGWEKDESSTDAALRETYEEAGVRGTMAGLLGTFDVAENGITKTRFWIYELHVEQVLEEWPEKKERQRQWFTYEEAIKALVFKPFMQEALSRTLLYAGHTKKARPVDGNRTLQ
ncbi:NUDIX hydrolase domain-like protein [Spinellus fusiger]|nr:NUDIX hydrolase domain-like protein [Spinellus fusiger]